MIGFVKLGLILLVGLTVVYGLVSLYSRSVRKERLENEWDADPPSSNPLTRAAHVAAGLAAYRHSLRRRLIVLIYVVPVVVIVVLTYLTNVN